MADNIVCKNCGHVETLHLRPQDVEEPGVLIDGYPVSLENCSGYEPVDPELAQRLAEKARDEEYKRDHAGLADFLGS